MAQSDQHLCCLLPNDSSQVPRTLYATETALTNFSFMKADLGIAFLHKWSKAKYLVSEPAEDRPHISGDRQDKRSDFSCFCLELNNEAVLSIFTYI